jgi:hypothetical protein
MTSSDAGSLYSILFSIASVTNKDEPISEQARIALPVCVVH